MASCGGSRATVILMSPPPAIFVSLYRGVNGGRGPRKPSASVCNSVSDVVTDKNKRPTLQAQLVCGVVAPPLFIIAFTVIGAKQPGYDWRRYPVSSLATGNRGWRQRANFGLAGALFLTAARGLGRCPRRSVGPRMVPALVAAAGVGLISSGLFVTDPVGDFPPVTRGQDDQERSIAPDAALTRSGKLHDLSAIPIFAGLPIAALASALGAARRGDARWAGYSAGSSLAMVGSFLAFGPASGPAPRLVGNGGIFQRISIATGFGWLTVLSLRALSIPRHS